MPFRPLKIKFGVMPNICTLSRAQESNFLMPFTHLRLDIYVCASTILVLYELHGGHVIESQAIPSVFRLEFSD